MNTDDEYEQGSKARRFGFGIGIGLVVLLVIGLVIGQIAKADHSPPSRMPEVFMVHPLPVTPPPPPPPKAPEPPKEVQKMVEQTPIDQPEDKPDDRPKDAPSNLTTSLTGPGSDGFGLGRGNGGIGGGGGGGGQQRSHFGWYAGEVQKTVQEALSRNPIANRAQFIEKARIWADESGRLVRVKLSGTTGDATVDRAIEESLTGLQLPEPPPSDMPMPIVMRIVARRPG